MFMLHDTVKLLLMMLSSRLFNSISRDLIDKSIVLPTEARVQLGFAVEPEEGDEAPIAFPKPKGEGERIVERTVRGVVEQLSERQARGE